MYDGYIGGDNMIQFFLGTVVLLMIIVVYAFKMAGGYKWVKGSGHLISVKEDVDVFNSLEVRHGFQVEIIKADHHEVTIEMDDNLVEYLEIYTENNTLHLGMKPDTIYKRATLKAKVYMQSMDSLKGSGATCIKVSDEVVGQDKFSLKLSGASSIAGKLISENIVLEHSGASHAKLDLQAVNLGIKLSGASDFNANGMTENVVLNASGASHIKAGKLFVKKADVQLSGASGIKMAIEETVEIKATGGSDIVILGQPTVTKQKVGAASSLKFKER